MRKGSILITFGGLSGFLAIGSANDGPVARMDRICNEPMENDGVEVDWLAFFTRLWSKVPTGGTEADRFTSEDIQNLWMAAMEPAPHKPYWETVRAEAEATYGLLSKKYGQFVQQGDDTAVDF